MKLNGSTCSAIFNHQVILIIDQKEDIFKVAICEHPLYCLLLALYGRSHISLSVAVFSILLGSMLDFGLC